MIPLINLKNSPNHTPIRFGRWVWVTAVLLLAGCILPESTPPATNNALEASPPSPTSAYPWHDENQVMAGICFEAAFDAAGQVFVLRSAEDHIHFYELADQSRLCRHPVTRYPFDFSSGDVLAGLWSKGEGCTARYEVVAYNRDDAADTFTITLRFITEGDCAYDLVSPFWVGLPGLAGYDIRINLETGG
ncbi:MAG: hypothetical protein H6672_01050 [Anaerolineaceae bacterium]|nr:hypothetical protein [Anaerolineaceae bacterium]